MSTQKLVNILMTEILKRRSEALKNNREWPHGIIGLSLDSQKEIVAQVNRANYLWSDFDQDTLNQFFVMNFSNAEIEEMIIEFSVNGQETANNFLVDKIKSALALVHG